MGLTRISGKALRSHRLRHPNGTGIVTTHKNITSSTYTDTGVSGFDHTTVCRK